MQAFWRVEEEWPWSVVAILGGGPSLTPEQIECLRARREESRNAARVIALNTQLQLAPWADLHFFVDSKWWRWHCGAEWYRGFAGVRVTLENPKICAREPGIRALKNYGLEPGLCRVRDGVHTGNNAGYMAINFAVHLGARRILLLGFDMRPVQGRTHWFGDHPSPTDPGVYAKDMLPAFATLVKPLKQAKVEVLNCTPGSALSCFPSMGLEQALALPRPIAQAWPRAA